MSEARYEWVTGPVVVSRSEAGEFNHGKGLLERGPLRRFLVGQVRDRELKAVLNWAMKAPLSRLQARVMAAEYAERWPRAEDWMRSSLAEADAKIPAGWTFPEAGDQFERGLVA